MAGTTKQWVKLIAYVTLNLALYQVICNLYEAVHPQPAQNVENEAGETVTQPSTERPVGEQFIK